jgi:chromosome segregation ATPase
MFPQGSARDLCDSLKAEISALHSHSMQLEKGAAEHEQDSGSLMHRLESQTAALQEAKTASDAERGHRAAELAAVKQELEDTRAAYTGTVAKLEEQSSAARCRMLVR